jgi:catechol 2,3-dioxygenase-like lactoylglutathione lyase family enzyme
MTDWFARPVLHVKDVDASARFYVNLLGFTGATTKKAERESHKSTGRAALSS